MSKRPRISGRARSSARSSARLAAVQALYDAEMTDSSADSLIKDFIDQALGSTALMPDELEIEREIALKAPDPVLLAAILRGALANRERLDAVIAPALSGDWHIERLEQVVKAILRAGAFELLDMLETPVRVVISEYVDIASAFYGGSEPGMVNAVLDRIAREARAIELSGLNLS